MTKITHPADQLVAQLTEGHEVADAPGGAYARVMVGKKSAAWLIRLKKDGGVRLILRTTDTPPKALAEGQMTESKTGHSQFRIGATDIKRGRQLIEWAVKQVTPAEAPALAAASKAEKPVAKPRARKAKLAVVMPDDTK